MYVCMICICVCMYIRMYVICMYVRMYVYMYVCMYVCMYACMICMYVCMHVCMYPTYVWSACITYCLYSHNMNICLFIHAHMHEPVSSFTDTHTRIHTRLFTYRHIFWNVTNCVRDTHVSLPSPSSPSLWKKQCNSSEKIPHQSTQGKKQSQTTGTQGLCTPCWPRTTFLSSTNNRNVGIGLKSVARSSLCSESTHNFCSNHDNRCISWPNVLMLSGAARREPWERLLAQVLGVPRRVQNAQPTKPFVTMYSRVTSRNSLPDIIWWDFQLR